MRGTSADRRGGDPAEGPRDDRTVRLALGVVVLVAVAVRVWMGAAGPDPSRFWDERYALENVAEVLEAGRLQPANAFHPTLAHLPQTALLGTARALCAHAPICADPVVEDGRFTPLAYRLSRWLQAAYGGLSLVVLFLAGRRLFGPLEGLVAAALLAAVPWHVRQSAIAKPDVLLSLLVTVAFAAALWVAARPVARRYAVAGVTVGLAGAAKYNGVTAALLLVAGTLAGARRRPRRLFGLALAGATAAATFAVLNPHLLTAPWMLRRDFLGRTLRDYAYKGAAHGGDGLDLAAHAATTLFTSSFHGPVVAAVALAGLVLVAVEAVRRPPGPGREGRVVLVAFPLLYVAALTLATDNPSAHNWLPLTPFTALAAARAGVVGWGWVSCRLASRLPAPVRRRLGVAALGVVVVASWIATAAYAYPATVPTTMTGAHDLLYGELGGGVEDRVIVVDPWEVQALDLRHAGRPATELAVTALRRPLAEALVRADAAVLREDGVAGGDADLAFPPGSRVHRFHPAPFHAWGPPLLVVVHAWRPHGPSRALAADGRGGHLVPRPAVPPGAHLSFVVRTVPGATGAEPPPARFAGHDLVLHWNRTIHGSHRWVGERVALPAGEGPWRLVIGTGEPGVVRRVVMHAWLPPRRVGDRPGGG